MGWEINGGPSYGGWQITTPTAAPPSGDALQTLAGVTITTLAGDPIEAQ